MTRRIMALVVAVAVAAPVAAIDTFYVPAAANAEGVNGTQWRTDLQVKAMGGADATFTVELLATGANNSEPQAIERSLAAGESLRLGNLLGAEFGITGTAALRVTATDGRVLVSSRTYNDDPSGTYGQTVPAVGDDGAVTFGGSATLIQLSRSSDPATGFRTNIGFVNVTDQTVPVAVELFASDGSSLGALSRNLKPFEHRQVNDAFAAVGADDVADGYAVARTDDQDGRFICYASVVDNGSGDAVFLLGAPELDPPPVHERLAVFESFLRPG